MNLGVLQTNCGKFKMSCQHNTGWQSVMSVYVRGLGMVKPVHAQHLLFQGRLQTSSTQVGKDRRRLFQVASLQSFSAACPTPQARLFASRARGWHPVPSAAEASLQSPSVPSASREPALNLRERLQCSLISAQQQYQKVKTDSSQKKISTACEI